MPERSRDEILRDVVPILKRLSTKPIDPRADSEIIADLGFDSIQVLELIAEIEDHFDVNVPLNGLGNIKTVGQMADHLASLMVKS